MTDDQVDFKFRTLAEGVISEKTQDKLLAEMGSLDKAASVKDLWRFETLRA